MCHLTCIIGLITWYEMGHFFNEIFKGLQREEIDEWGKDEYIDKFDGAIQLCFLEEGEDIAHYNA